MSRARRWRCAGAARPARLALAAVPRVAQEKEIVIGLQCDRTGPTQIVGTVLCPGYHDYIDLVNSKGGVEGYKIKVLEIDNEYKVPPAVEALRALQEGGRGARWRSTARRRPQALNQKLEEDKIPGTSPGFGIAAAADGKRYPVPLPDRRDLLVAGRRRGRVRQGASSAAASRARRSPISSTTTRPARSRCRSSRTSPKQRGLRAADLRGAAAGRRDGRAGARHHPALPARLRHRPPVRPLAVGRRSRSSSGTGYPLRKVIGLVWALGRGRHRGGRRLRAWPRATTRCSSPASATTTRCIKEIKAMYKAQGKPAAEGDGDHASSTTAAC